MKGQFKYSKDFIEAWAAWYLGKPETCPLKSRFLHYYWERREVHLMKLAMICSASRSNEMVKKGASPKVAEERAAYINPFMETFCIFYLDFNGDFKIICLRQLLDSHCVVQN